MNSTLSYSNMYHHNTISYYCKDASPIHNCNKEDHTMTPPPSTTFDLQEVLAQYQSQPELLKLILSSKVEEDKRRAEEAKLRAKELDLYLRQRSCRKRSNSSSSSSISSSDGSSSSSSSSTSDCPSETRRQRRRLSSVTSLNDDQQQEERRNSAAAAMVAMAAPSYYPTSPSNNQSPSLSYPSPAADFHDFPAVHDDSKQQRVQQQPPQQQQRRRREMQAITKIVETREFPYQDSYFWKNNGNTTQRKTGCKSIYYKCSNSNKGCPVNKTVTERPNGEYVIKYRGEHLPECGRVERIVDL